MVKNRILLVSSLLIICLTVTMVVAQVESISLDEAIKNAQEELKRFRRLAVHKQNEIQKERLKLLQELEDKRSQYEKLRRDLKHEERRRNAISSELSKKKEELQELQEMRREYIEVLRVKIDELKKRLSATITGFRRKDLIERVNDLQKIIESSNPDITYVTQRLFEVTNEELSSGSSISWFKGDIIDQRGVKTKARILTIGEVASFCLLADNTCGILTKTQDGKDWRMISKRLGYFRRKDVERFIEQVKSADSRFLIMPIDVSGGLAIAKRELTRTFAEYLSAGGVVMIPLLIVAILGILIIIERLITLSLIHSKTKDLTQKVSELCNEGRFQDAEKLCAQGSNPIARILRAGLSHREASKEIMEDMLREAILHELPRIERFLSTLGVLAMIAPFLGLLGTVTGMITTFNVITVHGTGDPGLLSGGISEALITTQAGLIIAIPILLLHAYISGKVNHVINDIEANATRLVNIMVEKG